MGKALLELRAGRALKKQPEQGGDEAAKRAATSGKEEHELMLSLIESLEIKIKIYSKYKIHCESLKAENEILKTRVGHRDAIIGCFEREKLAELTKRLHQKWRQDGSL